MVKNGGEHAKILQKYFVTKTKVYKMYHDKKNESLQNI